MFFNFALTHWFIYLFARKWMHAHFDGSEGGSAATNFFSAILLSISKECISSYSIIFLMENMLHFRLLHIWFLIARSLLFPLSILSKQWNELMKRVYSVELSGHTILSFCVANRMRMRTLSRSNRSATDKRNMCAPSAHGLLVAQQTHGYLFWIFKGYIIGHLNIGWLMYVNLYLWWQ